jgi:hypothetical protein
MVFILVVVEFILVSHIASEAESKLGVSARESTFAG